MLYLSGDWHYGHDKMVQGMANRPPDYEERLDASHRALVKDDTLICLGDVALYKRGHQRAEALLAELKAKGVGLICTLGNHDPATVTRMIQMGWHMAMDRMSLTFHGKHLVLSHEPIPMLGNQTNIHGHLHSLDGHRGGLIRDGKHILISMELLDYRPVPLSTVVSLNASPKYEDGRFVRAE
jgi:calcineurin-like phosphoesterase family protein